MQYRQYWFNCFYSRLVATCGYSAWGFCKLNFGLFILLVDDKNGNHINQDFGPWMTAFGLCLLLGTSCDAVTKASHKTRLYAKTRQCAKPCEPQKKGKKSSDEATLHKRL